MISGSTWVMGHVQGSSGSRGVLRGSEEVIWYLGTSREFMGPWGWFDGFFYYS